MKSPASVGGDGEGRGLRAREAARKDGTARIARPPGIRRETGWLTVQIEPVSSLQFADLQGDFDKM
jgi:hypothetical protein